MQADRNSLLSVTELQSVPVTVTVTGDSLPLRGSPSFGHQLQSRLASLGVVE